MAPRKFGKAQVEVSIKDRVGVGLKAINRRMQNFGRGLSSFGTKVGAIGGIAAGAATAVLSPVGLALKKFAAIGDTLDKTAARTGVGAQALGELGFAAEQSGANLGDLEKGFSGLSRSLFDAGRGSGEAVAALGAIGLQYDDLAGKAPEDQFMAVADGLSAITDASTRGAVAQKLFGRAGRQLLPMLENVRELRKEAQDLGIVLSETDTSNAARLTDAFNRVGRTAGGAFLQLGAALAEPVIRALAVVTQITSRVNKWVAANKPLVQQIAMIALAIGAAGTAAVVLGGTIVAVGAAIAAVGTIITAVVGAAATAFAVLTSPITLVALGVAAIGALALQASGGLSVLSDMFGTLGDVGKTAWGGIVAAISSGDMETAGAIAYTALEIGWLTLSGKMREVWSGLTSYLRNIWLNTIEGMIQVGANIYFGTVRYFDQLSVGLINGFDTAFVYIRGAIDAIQTQIAKAIIEAGRFFGMFSKAEAVQIQSSLDDELAKRAGKRESGLGSRFGDRQSGLSERDAQRRATADQFKTTVADDFDRRRQAGGADTSALDEAQSRLAALQAKLTGDVAAARVEADAEAKKPPPKLAALGQLSANLGQKAATSKALGTSSAAAVQAGFFGTARKPEEETAKNTRSMAKHLRNIALRPQAGLT